MNNEEFIYELSQRMQLSQRATARMADALTALMADYWTADNAVAISSFGSFEVKKKMERISLHPATQQRMLMPPKLVLNFRPSQKLKEKVNKEKSHE